MALVLKDRVLESSTSTGTGSFTLTGAQTGYQSFSAIGNGNTTYYTIQGKNPDGTLTSDWEVGIGTWSTGGTLARDTVLESSNSNNLVVFPAGDKDVFCTMPAEKVLTPTGTSSQLLANDGTGGLSNVTIGTNLTYAGGTLSATGGSMVYPGAGIPNSTGSAWGTSYGTSGANSVVLRDANQNIEVNAVDEAFLQQAATTPITLTASSTRRYSITGSGGQTIQLPDATTLANGAVFQFDNNQSSGAITVNNHSGTLVVSVPSGGYVIVILLSNAIAAGSWDRHDITPANVSWSTNTFSYPGSITSATWNGNTIAVNRGGTGTTTSTGTGSVVLSDNPTFTTNISSPVVNFNRFDFQTLVSTWDDVNHLGAINIGSNAPFFNDTIREINIGTNTGTGGAQTYITIGDANSTTALNGILTFGGPVSIPNGLSTGTSLSTTGTLALAGSSTANQTLATNQTSGTLTIGGASGTGAITVGRSTAAQTVNIATGVTAASTTKAVNIGTAGNATSTTNIAIGSTTGTSTTTLNGKTSGRIVPRVSTTASSAEPTINTDNTDQFGLTAQAVDITSFTTNLSGTPTDGQKLWIYIVGTAARAIAWGASFESSTATLPTTTVTTNRLDVGFVWNTATSKWRCVAVA